MLFIDSFVVSTSKIHLFALIFAAEWAHYLYRVYLGNFYQAAARLLIALV